MENLTILTSLSLAEFESNNGDYHEENYSLPKWVNIVLMVLHAVTMTISIGGNIVVCLVILLKKSLQTVGNYFVISLAFSDIIMVILCVPFTVLTNLLYYHWIFGSFLCPVVGYLQLASVIQRSFILLAAAADRHQAIWKPMCKRLSKRTAKILIVGIWIISLIIPLPIAMYSKLVSTNPVQTEELCLEVWPWAESKVLYGIGMMSITYIIPLIVLFCTYAHIVVILGRKPPGENEALRDKRRLCTKRKVSYKIIIMIKK